MESECLTVVMEEKRQNRIGIITMYYNSSNYGGLLQAYALCKYLNDSGYPTKQITYDFYRKTISSSKDYKNLVSFLFKRLQKRTNNLIIKTINIIHGVSELRKDRRNICAEFRASIPHTETVYNDNSIEDCNNLFDIFIAGSDQVWNKYLTGNDLMYFIPIRSVRKISYAVSMEYKSLDDISDHPEFYLSTLSSYAAISVREKAIADRLGTIGIKKVKMTCDPTLLLTKKDYLQLIKRGTRLSYGKYILVYHLAYSDELNKLAGYISQQTGFEVINVHTQLRTRRKKMEIQDFGPIDLLSLINNAEYVLTTSFHAVAFSLILEKQFYAIKTAFSNRIENILRCMNIENRLLEDTFPDMAQRIDYTQVESCRSRFINESIDFIKSNVI